MNTHARQLQPWSRRFAAAALLAELAGIGLLASCQSAGIHISATMRRLKADDGFELTTYRLVEQNATTAKPRAIVFYAQGSEDESALRLVDRLASFATMGMPVVMVERRGVTGADVDLETARRYATKARRVDDLLTTMDSYLADERSDLPVVLVGGSEGGDVAAAAAARCPRATHVLLLGFGGGWSQAEELRFFVGRDPNYLAIGSVAALDAKFAEIRSQPDADTLWLGHPYRRWASFLWSPPVDDLRKLRIPIFVAHGEKDESVPIESARALREKLERDEAVDLTLREYPGLDHGFKDAATGASRLPLLEVDAVHWLAEHGLLSRSDAARFEDRVHRAHPDVFAAQGE